MQKEKSLPAINYRLRLKEGNNIENLTNKAKKLYKKLLSAKGKDKASMTLIYLQLNQSLIVFKEVYSHTTFKIISLIIIPKSY